MKQAFGFAFLLLTTSCVGNVVGSEEVGDLGKNRQKWRDAGITSYTYREDRSCFCGFFGPADVTVEDGQIVGVRRFFPDTVDIAPANFAVFDTVESLFDMVAEAIDRDVHLLDVSYDEQLGFPSKIAIDYAVNVADDEITLTAASLVPTSN